MILTVAIRLFFASLYLTASRPEICFLSPSISLLRLRISASLLALSPPSPVWCCRVCTVWVDSAGEQQKVPGLGSALLHPECTSSAGSGYTDAVDKVLTLELATELQLLLLQPADPPLVGLGGQTVLKAALDIQIQLVLTRLGRQLSEAAAVGEGAAEQPRGRREREGEKYIFKCTVFILIFENLVVL